MERQDPLPVRRYLVAGVLTAVAVGGLLLVIRPILFSFAPPLTDANYTVASVAAAQDAPIRIEILLNEAHDLPGEVHRDERVGLTVVVSAVEPDAFAVVDAWSPTNDCAVTLGADRLVDCAGDSWTFDGVPIDPADPPLVAFPTTVKSGAVVVDFTRPMPAAAS
jgi:hypothetical protein